MAGSALGKVGVAVIVLSWLAVLIALVVDELLAYSENDEDDSLVYGATESKTMVNGKTIDVFYSEYSEGCEEDLLTDETQDDFCDIQGRGIVWIIANVISLIAGLVCIIGAFYYEVKLCVPLTLVFGKKVVGIACSATAGLASLIAVLAWWIDNPVLVNQDENDDTTSDTSTDDGDINLGASVWLALIASVGYFVATFFFTKVFKLSI